MNARPPCFLPSLFSSFLCVITKGNPAVINFSVEVSERESSSRKQEILILEMESSPNSRPPYKPLRELRTLGSWSSSKVATITCQNRCQAPITHCSYSQVPYLGILPPSCLTNSCGGTCYWCRTGGLQLDRRLDDQDSLACRWYRSLSAIISNHVQMQPEKGRRAVSKV